MQAPLIWPLRKNTRFGLRNTTNLVAHNRWNRNKSKALVKHSIVSILWPHTHTPNFLFAIISFQRCATVIPLGSYGPAHKQSTDLMIFRSLFAKCFYFDFAKGQSHRLPFDLIFYNTIPIIRTQSVSDAFFLFFSSKTRMEVFQCNPNAGRVSIALLTTIKKTSQQYQRRIAQRLYTILRARSNGKQ